MKRASNLVALVKVEPGLTPGRQRRERCSIARAKKVVRHSREGAVDNHGSGSCGILAPATTTRNTQTKSPWLPLGQMRPGRLPISSTR